MSAKVIVMVTVGIMVFGGFDQVGRHCNCGHGAVVIASIMFFLVQY